MSVWVQLMSGEVIEASLSNDTVYDLQLYLSDRLQCERIAVSKKEESGEYVILSPPDPLTPGETYYAVVAKDPEYFLRYLNEELVLFEEDKPLVVKNKNSGLFYKNSSLPETALVHIELCEAGWELLQTMLEKNGLWRMGKEDAARKFSLFFLDRAYEVRLAE